MCDLKLKNSWKKTGEKLHDIEFGKDFLDMTPEHSKQKQKKANGTTSNFKTNVQQKETISRVKVPSMEQKIRANHVSDKWLISRI